MGNTKKNPSLSGIASSPHSIVDAWFGPTQILPGAFRNTIQEWKLRGEMPPFCWSHDYDSALPIGGVSRLWEDPRQGLLFSAWTDSGDEFAIKVLDKIESRLITGVSIGFTATKVRNGKLSDGSDGRLVSEVRLFEISACLFPADDAARITSVGGVSLQNHNEVDEDIARMVEAFKIDTEISRMAEKYEWESYIRRRGYQC